MTRLVAPDYVFLNGRLQTGLVAEIGQHGITRLRPRKSDETPDLTPHVLMPACIDLQVNGAGGVMLNSETSAKGIAHIISTLRKLGTAWVLPTLITCEPERIIQAAHAAVECKGMDGFFGLHIEGPHLNPARKGTHRVEFIRPMDASTLEALKILRKADVPVMLTLAPEMVPSDTIREIADMGVVVSAGHTNGTTEQARAGLEAGISCFTHLYNAMPPMTSREPGVVGTAIGSDAFVGIIVDGHHVTWEMVGVAWRARPKRDRMFLVSDAMSTIGGPDHFELYGERIEVRDGALVNAAGSLAGAHIDMVGCLANLVQHVGAPLEEAIRAACVVPADVMGVASPNLGAGTPLPEVLALDNNLQRISL
ncbi:N-acetylglucosamine-6-phosphate deacetylase [Brucella pseudogrignonensis]|uniref:N-acetylglucosamine-6-phosphate deacetylase n=1 Tax=Brucella pseudogrignonensis TaxID=419475 RepID=UPI000CFAEBBA|nr:N-acetylglucosamine-6-phosphate deacetylase [Brucella pseudogrignonensis]MQP41984.1 N-acetylglucosamine-6-phosphate deacetylase [Ochrobactrum sp. MYb237]PQZ41315.1 N-acetylglucosamine-6-phosphate deacetylase [Brucella pseudogrignonensis]PRA39383.1 N-acetylglucosamine-6-phosphate deacetylase [Brucella pseudogrignonensis]PRA64902.1 N-acetylglucosamine-6-phosphate deacetylase [Brucella pseudogrignonensis]